MTIDYTPIREQAIQCRLSKHSGVVSFAIAEVAPARTVFFCKQPARVQLIDSKTVSIQTDSDDALPIKVEIKEYSEEMFDEIMKTKGDMERAAKAIYKSIYDASNSDEIISVTDATAAALSALEAAGFMVGRKYE